MPTSWAEIIGSKTFQFIVGENVDGQKTIFDVYEEAIAKLSDELRALITRESPGPMGGWVVWKDVSKQTFERFYQFAVIGDYSIPEPQMRKEEEPVPEIENNHAERDVGATEVQADEWPPAEVPYLEEPYPGDEVTQEIVQVPAEVSWGNTFSSHTIAKIKKNKKLSKKRFDYKEPEAISYKEPEALPYPLLAPRTNFLDTCEPADVFLKDHSYSNVLLSHVNLYILADSYTVGDLKNLTLYKLHKTLLTFELDSQSIGDIIDLANHVYSCERIGSGKQALRDLVCRFLVDHTVILTADERFMDLLENGGDFAKDLWKHEVQRKYGQ
ncbi:hypothetical protein HYFRA_00009893 [Hymenoscyphus fraxineus]|uniref:BTB domain-containing protein n=1 Tax=Hymenoscyphus fraxineus TaxID=746836 RepID=A0A9N9L4S7_9HELO|nr:hypothetical protein HYFRA_00009893 [Hymenoscyphus fraxineus]